MVRTKRALSILSAAILVFSISIESFFMDVDHASAATYGIIFNEIEYDPEDMELSIEFYTRVKYRRNMKVRILDSSGRNYARYVEERDSDEMELKVNRLKYGRKYKLKITGIKKYRARKWRTITKTFRAIDN